MNLALTPIHRSAWKEYSRKFGCRIVHSPGPMGQGFFYTVREVAALHALGSKVQCALNLERDPA